LLERRCPCALDPTKRQDLEPRLVRIRVRVRVTVRVRVRVRGRGRGRVRVSVRISSRACAA